MYVRDEGAERTAESRVNGTQGIDHGEWFAGCNGTADCAMRDRFGIQRVVVTNALV
jgi:hypothetical protein